MRFTEILINGVWAEGLPQTNGELYRVRTVVSVDEEGNVNERIIELRYSVPVTDNRITKLAFRNRFTFAEKVALEDAAKTDTEVKVLLDDQASATYIDLSRADTAAGVDLLVSKGLLTQQRRDEILNAPINDEDERP